MGLFDDFLGRVEGAATDLFGDEAGDWFDRAEQMLAGDDGEAAGDDGGGVWDGVRGLFGGSDDASDSDSDGGPWGALSGLVDRLSGDSGDGDNGWFSSVMDRASGLLPENIRDEAEALFRGDGNGGGGWSSMLGNASDLLPESWQSAAGAAFGPTFGEAGHAGLGQQHVDAFTGRDTDAHEPAPRVDADDYDDLVTGGMPQNTGVAGGVRVEPNDDTPPSTYDDGEAMVRDDVVTAPTSDANVSELVDPIDVAPEPMDDFEQSISDANEIEDSFDAMLEGLQ